MKKYVSTATLCELYELDAMFFLRRKKDGLFIERKHFIQKAKTLRWDLDMIELWWRDDEVSSVDIDDILNRVLL